MLGLEVLDQVKRSEWHWASEAVAVAEVDLKSLPVALTSETREGEPAHQILEAASGLPADLVVVGSHGWTGLDAFLLGSVARNVAKHAPCSVLVARATAHGLRRVVLAVDELEHAAQAAAFLRQLPLPPETEIVLTHVLRPVRPFHGLVPTEPGHLAEVARQAREAQHQNVAEFLARTQAQVAEAGRAVRAAIREGDPAEQILQAGGGGAGGPDRRRARGVSLVKSLVVGSVADRLLKAATCSVLIVR